ncbi:MAG: hypothetical protein IK088_04610, partial [Lachnospiraceae bacterium]|nr:hypothetical protein [Lachnospiraceae bacterium]
MQNNVVRYDMTKPPVRCKWFWQQLSAALCVPSVLAHKTKIVKTGTEGLKPPYLLLCNHNAFQDFKVALKCTYPHKTNFVVAIDGFIGREQLLRDLGCICKRKFTNDVTLVRHLRTVAKKGDIPVIYPEARYSLCGTTAVLPESLGKLCKLLNIPVVVLICHGHHVNSPFWNLKGKSVKGLEAEFSLLLTPEELSSMTVEEINTRLVRAFQYDDFAWQKERGIRITYPKRAEGLHKVLYQCPHCKTEFRMKSEGTKLFCTACGKSWTMTELGELAADSGETEFSHIPDWYEWERENVRNEVEAGTYSTGELSVLVRSLPNAKKFIELGNGTMVHDMNGFRVSGKEKDGTPFEMVIRSSGQYSVH